MHQKLTKNPGLVVTRNVDCQILKVVDPKDVQARSRHRFRRRLYCAKELIKQSMAHRRIQQAQTVWILYSQCYRWL